MSKPILLMTRPIGASERFVAGLDPVIAAKAEIIFAPLITIVQMDTAFELAPDVGAIFSSSQGVAFAPSGEGRPAYCVGARTASAAAAKGWNVVLCAQNADALVAQMPAADIKHPLVHLAGRHRRGNLVERLTALRLTVRVQELYDQVLTPLSPEAKKALLGEAVVIVPLFSPRSATQFAREAPVASNARILAMSASVGAAVRDVCQQNVQIVQAPTSEDMQRGVENLLCDNSLP